METLQLAKLEAVSTRMEARDPGDLNWVLAKGRGAKAAFRELGIRADSECPKRAVEPGPQKPPLPWQSAASNGARFVNTWSPPHTHPKPSEQIRCKLAANCAQKQKKRTIAIGLLS